MKKIFFTIVIGLSITSVKAQKREYVYRVDGDMVTNSSGTFFRPAGYTLQSSDNPNAKRNVVGNFNRDASSFFWVYPADQIDILLKSRDGQIADLQKQIADLQASLVLLQHSVTKLKKQVAGK